MWRLSEWQRNSAFLGLLVSACAHVALMSSLPAPSIAAGRAGLVGRVRGKAFTPSQQSAMVWLFARRTAWHDSTMTDAHGLFTFRDLVPGDYVLRVRMIGYLQEQRVVSMDTGTVRRVDMILQRSPIPVQGDCVAPDGGAMGAQYCR